MKPRLCKLSWRAFASTHPLVLPSTCSREGLLAFCFLSDFCSVLTTLSSPPSFHLSQTLWQIWQELSSLSSCFIRLQWVPGHRFFRGTTQLMSWPEEERYLLTPKSLVVFLLLSLVSILVLSRTGGVLSHRNSLTHRFPRFPPRNLCSLVMLAVFSLVYAATDTAFFYVLISRGLAELIILPAAPVDTRPRTPLISFCTVNLRNPYAGSSLATLCLFTTSGPDHGSFPGFWGEWSAAMPPSLGRGRVNNNNITGIICKIGCNIKVTLFVT